MRFGDSRVQALAGALCVTLCAVTGITNRSLRALMTGLLGAPYTHDPGLLRPGPAAPQRPDHPPPARQHLRPDPRRPGASRSSTPRSTTASCAPLFAAGQPQAPPQLRAALRTIEHHIDDRLAARQAACGSLTNSAQLSKSPTQRVATLRPGLRPEGVALRAVRLTGRDEPGTFGAWLMTSPSGTAIC